MKRSRDIDLETFMAEGPQTIPEMWRWAVKCNTDRPVMICDEDGGVLTYGEAATLVKLVQRRLTASGVAAGDRIALNSPVHPEAFAVFWAAVTIGAIVVPIDYRLSPAKIAALLAKVEPRMVFADSERLSLIPVTEHSLTVILDDPAGTYPAADNCFSAWLDDAENEFTASDPCLTPDNPAVILFTSGTSGEAKGVVLSHGALCRSGRLMSQVYGWQSGDVLFSLGDMHTMSGLRNPAIAAVHAGCSFVAAGASTRMSAICAADCIDRHGVTLLTTVPAMLNQLVRSADRIPPGVLTSLRQVLSTGSVLPARLVDAFEERYGLQVLNYYGLTETAGLCIGELPAKGRKQLGSIGVPLGSDVRIVDVSGHPSGIGETGELQIRTPNLMSGYYGNSSLTSEALCGAWYRTGDLAMLTSDGQVILLERIGDLVKDTRGEFVFPAEIEQVLESHPSVVEAGVSPVRTSMGDVELSALLVTATPAPLAPELIDDLRHLVACRLGTTKVPSLFHQVSELPRGVNGKLLRRKFLELLPDGEE